MEKRNETSCKKVVLLLLFFPLFLYSQFNYDYTIIRELTDTFYSTEVYREYIDTILMTNVSQFSINNIENSVAFVDTADNSTFNIGTYSLCVDDQLSTVYKEVTSITDSTINYFNFHYGFLNRNSDFSINKKYTKYGNNNLLIFRYKMRVLNAPTQSFIISINTIIKGTYNN